MNRLLIGLIISCVSLPFIGQAQTENKTIDTILVNTFFAENAMRRALEYQDVFKNAKKIFKKGKMVNRIHLEGKFYSRDFLAIDSTESGMIRYRIFAGSNGIIGQDIMLYVNKQGKVKQLEIRGYGR